MIGVQPLATQHTHFFEAGSDEDAVLQVPKVADKQQQLTEKVTCEACLWPSSCYYHSGESADLPMCYVSVQDVLVPMPPKSGWSKVTELVFGL